MESRLLSVLGKAAGLAGLALGLFYLIIIEIHRSVHILDVNRVYHLWLAMLVLTFGIAAIGIFAWVVSRSAPPKKRVQSSSIFSIGMLVILATVVLFAAAGLTNIGPESRGTVGHDATVQITKIPTFTNSDPEEMAQISGTVSGIRSNSDFRIIIFAVIGKNEVFVQPTTDHPGTLINDDGTWHSLTHRGDIYYAFLVNSQFKPLENALPPISGEVLAFHSRSPGDNK